jgi:hypothetical protein
MVIDAPWVEKRSKVAKTLTLKIGFVYESYKYTKGKKKIVESHEPTFEIFETCIASMY